MELYPAPSKGTLLTNAEKSILYVSVVVKEKWSGGNFSGCNLGPGFGPVVITTF